MTCSCCCALQARGSQKLAPVTGSEGALWTLNVLCTAGGWCGLQPLHGHPKQSTASYLSRVHG